MKYTYETKSLDEFAVLMALGAEVVHVDRITDPRFFKFSLRSDVIDLEKKALELASKTLEINAYQLCDAMRRCKSVVHSGYTKSVQNLDINTH